MKRMAYLTLSLGTASLLILLLVMAIGAQGPDHVGGNIIKVPDDYPTIQAAIDAAAIDGDTIQVAAGTYKENLAITKGITLSGGWSADFTTREPGASTIDGQGLGRVISITTDSDSTMVTIDGFTIVNGDASGLSIPLLPELSDAADHTAVAGLPEKAETAQGLDPVEHAAELRAHLVDLAARGLYPGGEPALHSMLEQLQWRTAQAEQARALANSMPALDKAGLEADPGAGGGIYSWNASLHLFNSTIEDNVGATNSEGYGGGIFADQGDTITISGNVIKYNTAGMYGDGRGGGLYLTHASGAVVEDNLFLENAASNGGGEFGAGGGLYVNESSGALVQRNQVLRNTAHASWDCSGWGGGGTAGGAQIRKSDGAIVKDNLFHNNLSALHCGSHTGGLYVYRGIDVQVSGNELIDNWGVLFQIYTDDYGGGLGLDTLINATVTGNTVRNNVTSLATPDRGWNVPYGGGIYGHMLSDSQVTSNTVTANTASVMHTAFGGGMYLEAPVNLDVAGNILTGNSASLSDSGGGTGGGLDLRNPVGALVQGNRVEGNRASAAGYGAAGGLEIASWGLYSFDNIVDANLFMDNQASGDLAEGSQGGAAVIYSNGLTFTNNVVAGNEADEAGGLYLGIAENGEITNNTLASNSDAAVLLAEWTTPVTFTNNIVVDHTVGISVTEVATATLRYTLWDGNGTDIGGSGTFTDTYPVSGDPAFAGPDAGDYHLNIGSAAIDAGDPAGVPPAPDHDLDGAARPQWTAVDIGAYEWQGYWQHLPVVANHFTPRTGWAIGDDETGTAAIVHTADGGLTWEAQGDPNAWTGSTGNDISAVDDQTAWAAVGPGIEETGGAILHTTDGGATWVTQTIPDGLTGGIKGVKGLSRDEAWAASLGGTVLHTTDSGATWNVVPLTTVAITQVNRIDAMGSNVWIADASNTGAVVHTQDGGLTWRAESLRRDDGLNDSPLTVHAFNPLAVWVSGSLLPHQNPSFYRTADGGDHWDFVKQVGANDHLDDICAASPDDVWGAVNGNASTGIIWRVHVEPDGTPDAKNVTPPELGGFAAEGVTCLDTRVAWVAAQNERHFPGKPLGIILHTTDGGESWVQQSAPPDIEYWKISFVGARR